MELAVEIRKAELVLKKEATSKYLAKWKAPFAVEPPVNVELVRLVTTRVLSTNDYTEWPSSSHSSVEEEDETG
ncbi:unnamed protein product [Cylicostephanus goldi]|uniref:Uncharacterized protein n=1 Tax=Cylicostephanus goldi TaxID=71465 RepID=A0A3P7PRJ4_CYLGO|nr:unnamed protein product [Cylicostephanus goldi]